MASVITSLRGDRDSCINVPASYLSKGAESSQDCLQYQLHNTPLYSIFFPLCLSSCSLTHASQNHLPSELLNACTQLCASGYAYRGPRLRQWSLRLFLCLSFFFCKMSKWNKNPFQLSHSQTPRDHLLSRIIMRVDLFTLEEQTASFS